MIEINLISDEKKRRKKGRGLLPAGFVLPREVVIGLIGGFLVFLALWHILLQAVIMVKYIQLKGQQVRWERFLPEKKQVDEVIKNLRDRQAKIKVIEDIRGNTDFSWAKKLNAVSNNIPRGVWLRQWAFEEGGLLIKGSCVSKNKVEMINVHGFVKKMKEDNAFMEGVSTIELESIKNRQVGETTVADFAVRAVVED